MPDASESSALSGDFDNLEVDMDGDFDDESYSVHDEDDLQLSASAALPKSSGKPSPARDKLEKLKEQQAKEAREERVRQLAAEEMRKAGVASSDSSSQKVAAQK